MNTAPLRVELEAGLFHETRTVDGKIVLEGFQLSGLQPLLTEAGAPDLSGSLSLALAKRRAEAVEDYLVNQHGVSASRTAV